MKYLSLFLLFPALLAACGERTAPGNAPGNGSGNSATVAASPAPPPGAPALPDSIAAGIKHFDVKSGILELKNAPATGTQTLYFDDYGRRQAMYIDLKLNGSQMHTVQIIDGGWFYSYDPDEKTGKRTPAPPEGLNPIPDPVTLRPDQRTAYQYRDLEPKTLLGKKAQGYALELSGDYPASSIKVWHWNRVPLRMEMQVPDREKMLTEAIKAQFDVPVPEERFRVPADIVITDEVVHH